MPKEFYRLPDGRIVYQCPEKGCGTGLEAFNMVDAYVTRAFHKVLEHSPIKEMSRDDPRRRKAIEDAMREAKREIDIELLKELE